jgi:hypothetical protein
VHLFAPIVWWELPPVLPDRKFVFHAQLAHLLRATEQLDVRCVALAPLSRCRAGRLAMIAR